MTLPDIIFVPFFEHFFLSHTTYSVSEVKKFYPEKSHTRTRGGYFLHYLVELIKNEIALKLTKLVQITKKRERKNANLKII